VLKAQHHRGREVTRTPQGSCFLLQKAAMPQPNSILLSFARAVWMTMAIRSKATARRDEMAAGCRGTRAAACTE
jgi:hypothetical protein